MENIPQTINVKGQTWEGKLTAPRYTSRCSGVPAVEFAFELLAPVKGKSVAGFEVSRPAQNIHVYQGSDLGKNLITSLGLKKDQDIDFRIPADSLEIIRETISAVHEEYRKGQEAITVSGWHWALGGDSHRVLLYPNEEKDTPEVKEITRLAHDTCCFDDLLRPSSKMIERDVSGLYITGSWYEISDADLCRIIAALKAERAAKKENREKAEQKKYNAALKEAQETGKPVILRSWVEDCNDPREECDMDNMIEYVNPDGSRKTERNHTW